MSYHHVPVWAGARAFTCSTYHENGAQRGGELQYRSLGSLYAQCTHCLFAMHLRVHRSWKTCRESVGELRARLKATGEEHTDCLGILDRLHTVYTFLLNEPANTPQLCVTPTSETHVQTVSCSKTSTVDVFSPTDKC